MKVRVEKLSDKEIMHTLDVLYTATSNIKGREAMKLFLRDLLTKSERIMLGRRIIIARKLIEGETYEDIVETLHVGFDTIRRVQRWLNDQMPGYEKAVEGMKEEFDRRQTKKLHAQSMLYRLKKKYPLHFLLFPSPKLKDKVEVYRNVGKGSSKNKK